MVKNGSKIYCTPSFTKIAGPDTISYPTTRSSGFDTAGTLVCGSGSNLKTERISRYHISDNWRRTLIDEGEYIKLQDKTGLSNREDILVSKYANGNTTNYCVRIYY